MRHGLLHFLSSSLALASLVPTNRTYLDNVLWDVSTAVDDVEEITSNRIH